MAFPRNDRVLEIRGAPLGYAVYGSPGGIPAFYFHGLPGSRREGALLHAACLEAGVRIIAPERPGYGLSATVPGPRLEDWPARIEALADALGIGRFHLIAVSGGAPYALACAGTLDERVRGTAICCGLGDLTRSGLAPAMQLNARLALWLVRRGPAWLQWTYGPVVTQVVRRAPRLAVAIQGWIDGPADRAVLRRPEIRALFADSLGEAFRQGAAGAVADLAAAVRPWPFGLDGIRNLQLWHGLADRVVPPVHSEWLKRAVPEARLTWVPGEGHFSLPIRHTGDVVRALVRV
ncbi:alpha/beta fold hydrolase [Thiohalobacter thiocyanaticus]|uniref:Alpha/beta hydrolase n=1 Tax=Thiohalobacter thiocyanaticus TaxID=585455 RepID=A0A426QIJ5_9GAMM|nr:alpha/beta hydrolase [Thiohalobacter thiocyanaticus]RRQ21536.1 alpha/beta hydrolase [Thiohalobacter thiocyanaticus]